jgi:hypothetical protein
MFVSSLVVADKMRFQIRHGHYDDLLHDFAVSRCIREKVTQLRLYLARQRRGIRAWPSRKLGGVDAIGV